MPDWVQRFIQDYTVAPAVLAGGIFLTLWSADRLVKHSVHLAVSYRVPKNVVGAVILGFGTSLPELLVSVISVLTDRAGLALGNIVGSNIANVGLILGVGALLATVHMGRQLIRIDLPLGLMVAIFLTIWVTLEQPLGPVVGYSLLGVFVVYLALSLRHTRRHRAVTEIPDGRRDRALWADVAWIVFGLVALLVGANGLVEGAAQIARLFGVSHHVIGVSMVAVGTSLPELAATIAAARKGETDIAVGNIAGSNLFNLLLVLGVVASFGDVPLSQDLLRLDFLFMAGFAVLAFPLFQQERRIGRIQGGGLLLLYGLYVWYVYVM